MIVFLFFKDNDCVPLDTAKEEITMLNLIYFLNKGKLIFILQSFGNMKNTLFVIPYIDCIEVHGREIYHMAHMCMTQNMQAALDALRIT
jgi:hypothetical protein